MLPIEVETYEHAAKRYPAAIAKTWDGDAIVADVKAGNDKDRPGKTRQHIFDLEGDNGDVWRLIISMERHSACGRVLHVSASRERALGKGLTADGVVTRSIMLLAMISGSDRMKPDSVSFSPKGVVHLVFKTPEAAEVM